MTKKKIYYIYRLFSFQMANLLSSADIPVYLYNFDEKISPNPIFRTYIPTRAAHGDDLQYVFGAIENKNMSSQYETEKIQFANDLMGAFSSFVHNGWVLL